MKYGTPDDLTDVQKLSFYDQENLKLQGNYLNTLDEKVNREEAINQDEESSQLAKLNGLTDKDISDAKRLFNDLYLDSLSEKVQKEDLDDDLSE